MKKILSILLCAVLTMSLVACDNSSTGDASSSKASSSSKPASSTTASSEKVSSSVDSSEAQPTSSVLPAVPEVNTYQQTTYNLVEITDYFHITGRTAVSTSTALTGSKSGMLFDHAGQGMLFKADCEGDVTLSLALSVRKSDTEGLHYFTVYIDGVKQDRITAQGFAGSSRIVDLKVAGGLSRGVHTIEVYRNHESCLGISTLLSLTMNGVPQKWVSDPNQLKIEFFGDSITSGQGVHGKKGAADQGHIKYCDGTATYAFVASRILNAEASIVSCSGLCIASEDMYKYYDKLSWDRDHSVDFDHSKMDVDLYVIALGTNDTSSYNNHSDEQITKDVETVLASVREDHPNAKILWVYGQLANTKANVIKNAVNEAGGEAAGFYYYCCKMQDWSGGYSHPSAAAQERDGKEVAKVIKQILNIE